VLEHPNEVITIHTCSMELEKDDQLREVTKQLRNINHCTLYVIPVDHLRASNQNRFKV